MTSIRFGVWSSVGLCAFGFTAQVIAAEANKNELEEIIVTAERRTTDVQNVAASVSVRSGDELTAQGKYSTRQILEDIAGLAVVDNQSLNVGSADVQGNNITIRGITPGLGAGGGDKAVR